MPDPIKNSVAVLREAFTRALSDQTVNLAEAESLIADVSKDKVTQSERRQFREVFYANRDKFDAAAQARLDKFIDDEIPAVLIPDESIGTGGAGTVADPEVLNEHKTTLTYSAVDGSLFVGGVSGDDVMQGMIGDCYFAAAMSEVAWMHPEVIERAFKQNDDGTLSVTFYERAGWGQPPRPVEVKIDGDLPLRYGGLIYAHARENKELWVPLLEKAFAQWKGNFEAIGNGGNSGAAMAALSGGSSDYISVSPSADTRRLFDQVKAATDAKKMVVAGTYGEHSNVNYGGTGVYADHAYAVIGTAEKDGVRYIQLRNPWGEVEPGNDGKDDGIFLMPVDAFAKLYSHIDVVNPN